MPRGQDRSRRRTVLPARQRRQFEAFLAELSAAFAELPTERVDEGIHEGLRRIVEFLRVDRSGFGQRLPGDSRFSITHSYEVPGVPPTPKVIIDVEFPVYARKVREGHPFRLPEDVVTYPDAVAERAYIAQSGLKSQLTIPLKVAGSVVGGIGFASFRFHLQWPDAVAMRLGLIGEVFAHALARKQAFEMLQSSRRQAEDLQAELDRATQRLHRAVAHARERHDGHRAGRRETQDTLRLVGSLTPRERQVFELAAAGMANKVIAARLGLCLQTVKYHRGRLMRKLHLDSAAALGRLAEKADGRETEQDSA